MRTWLLWLTPLIAGCAGQNWLASSFNSSTVSSNSPSSNTSSRASSDSSAASSGTTRQSDASSSGQSSVISAASVLLVAAGVGITIAIYATQARNRPVQPRKKKVRRDRNQPVEGAPQPELQPSPPAPLPLPEPGALPPEPSVPPLPPLDAMVQSRAWLVANELQLQQDLALGAGPSIDDLAGLAGIEPERRAHFGRVLQRHREELLAPHELTPEQAAAVMARLGALVMADPLLRIDGEAALAER